VPFKIDSGVLTVLRSTFNNETDVDVNLSLTSQLCVAKIVSSFAKNAALAEDVGVRHNYVPASLEQVRKVTSMMLDSRRMPDANDVDAKGFRGESDRMRRERLVREAEAKLRAASEARDRKAALRADRERWMQRGLEARDAAAAVHDGVTDEELLRGLREAEAAERAAAEAEKQRQMLEAQQREAELRAWNALPPSPATEHCAETLLHWMIALRGFTENAACRRHLAFQEGDGFRVLFDALTAALFVRSALAGEVRLLALAAVTACADSERGAAAFASVHSGVAEEWLAALLAEQDAEVSD
jgi:hypothetical protein